MNNNYITIINIILIIFVDFSLVSSLTNKITH